MLFRLIIFIQIISTITNASNLDFCSFYKCECPKPDKEIKCKLNNSTIKKINLNLNPSVNLIDLSQNNLEVITFQSQKKSNLNRLLLSNNKLKTIDDSFLTEFTELNELDLSNNNISQMQETAFKNLHSKLVKLNLSNAFNSNHMLTRELCELVSLKVLDLSGLNLANFSLECWQSQPGQIEYLYLKNTRNIDQSWSKWYPYIGNKLNLIDLTNCNIVTIDSNLSKQTLLTSLILANNKQLEEASLFQLLHSSNLIGRLIELNLANITSANKTLINLIDHSPNVTLNLERLDISNNNFNTDLNAFLFNQLKLKKLKSFKASRNKFEKCNEKLITINNVTLLDKLELLDLSFNSLESSKCLYSIKRVNSLQMLDLSHNKLSLVDSDIVELSGIFELTTNLSSIDLSHNMFSQFSVYFNPYHTKITKFDLSFNDLKAFRFVSLHARDSVKYPFNLNENPDDYDEDEEDDEDGILVDNKHNKNEIDDDDERFLIIDLLDLRHNSFNVINLQHMLQSVRNVRTIDLSRNPIERVIRMSNDRDIIQHNEEKGQDDLTEILCIDTLDLSNCHIDRIPNLEHVCINRLNLAYNQIGGNVHILMSNFSIYFTDYINLQYNNITKVKLALSNQKFKQDFYLKKNSPNKYYFGETTSHNLIHTYVDLNNNKFYHCDCAQISLYRETSYVQLMHECLNDTSYRQQCSFFNTKVTIYSLNKKFRILFVITCGLLMILSGLIVYYMCSDCVQNMQPYKMIRFNWKKLSQRYKSDNMENDDSKVKYSKLDNDLTASSNHINIVV